MDQTFTRPSVTIHTIPGGDRGTEKTIERMRDAVLGKLPGMDRHEGAHMPEVRFLAQQIVSDVPSKDYMGEARAIFKFMTDHVRYTLDPRALEWVQTPWWTSEVIGQGDCDDHAVTRRSARRGAGARRRVPHRQG